MKTTLQQLDRTWTLFLDRDGVINVRLMADYVKNVQEFEFIEGSLDALVKLHALFQRMVVVTNQQGIGKGIMTEADLREVHQYMLKAVEQEGGKIDQVYHCPELAASNALCRKPNIGMAEAAKKDFPEINFTKSIMVGDSLSDLEFGKRAKMLTVYISEEQNKPEMADFQFASLFEFYEEITKA